MMERLKKAHSQTRSSSNIRKKRRSKSRDSNLTDMFYKVLSFVVDESADPKFVK